MHRTPTPDPRANPRGLIDQLAPHLAERPGNEPGSMTACPHVNFLNLFNDDPNDTGIAGVDIYKMDADGSS
jgi:hypothetical protein